MSEYQAKNWLNYTNTTTPITAGDLNRIDSGVEELMTRVASLEQSGGGGGGGSVTCTGASTAAVTAAKNEILSELEPIKENLSVLAESSVNSGIVQHGFIQIKGNGLTIIDNFDLSNCTMFEYCACVKFTTAPYPSVVYSLFGSKLTHYVLPSLEIGQNGIIGRISSDGSTWSNYQDEWAINWSEYLNNFLFLKLRYADGKAAIYSSTDGVNFTARTTPTACSAPFVPFAGGNDYNKLLLGGGGETSDHAFTVFSDTEGLNVFNSYVKLNGTVVWGRQIAGNITDDE